MKLLKVYAMGVCTVAASGCMTMDGLKETKKEYSEGNLIAGTWMGLMSVSILPILDVFTLGGALDADTAGQVWTGAATTYAQGEQQQQAIKNQQQQVLLKAQQQAVLQAQQQAAYNTTYNQASSNTSQNYNYGSTTNTTNSSSSSSSSNSSNTTVKRKTASPLNQCITVDNKSNSMATMLINRCNQKLWVKWVDSGNCRSGCSNGIAAYGKSAVTKIKGQYNMAVCPYSYSAYVPNAPKPSGYEWKGGQFQCVDWG